MHWRALTSLRMEKGPNELVKTEENADQWVPEVPDNQEYYREVLMKLMKELGRNDQICGRTTHRICTRTTRQSTMPCL